MHSRSCGPAPSPPLRVAGWSPRQPSRGRRIGNPCACDRHLHPAQGHEKDHVRHGLVQPDGRERRGRVPELSLFARLRMARARPRQRRAMFTPWLHPCSGHRPKRFSFVDLLHSAPSTSPVRAAVRIRNSIGEASPSRPDSYGCTRATEARTFDLGQSLDLGLRHTLPVHDLKRAGDWMPLVSRLRYAETGLN